MELPIVTLPAGSGARDADLAIRVALELGMKELHVTWSSAHGAVRPPRVPALRPHSAPAPQAQGGLGELLSRVGRIFGGASGSR